MKRVCLDCGVFVSSAYRGVGCGLCGGELAETLAPASGWMVAEAEQGTAKLVSVDEAAHEFRLGDPVYRRIDALERQARIEDALNDR